MRKRWKALTVLAVVILLFVPAVERSLNPTVGSVLLIGTFSYAISLLFSAEIPAYRRWSTGYLALSGFHYVLVGLMGIGGFGLLTSGAWYHMISPGPLLAILAGAMHPSSFNLYKLNYWICPRSESGENWLSIFAILLGTTAVAAAIAMGRNKKLGFIAWIALLILPAFGALGYVLAELGKWGMPQYEGAKDYTTTTIALVWATSYFVAYAVAIKGVALWGRRSNP